MLKKRFLKWLAMALSVILAVWVLQTFFLRNMDYDQVRVEGFYLEEPDSLDVVLLGSSELFRDYSAAQAYEEFGFTSYPYAVNGNPVSLWKYELQDIIERQHPQLIVVETNGALYEDKLLFQEVCVRRVVDNMPESAARRAIIREMGQDTPLSYYLSLYKYHDNWENLKDMLTGAKNTLSLRLRGYSYLKGSSTSTERMKADDLRDIRGDMTEEALEPVSEQLLREFLAYCQEEVDAKVVFVRFPHCIRQTGEGYLRYKKANAAERIIRSYGFDYINLDQCLDEMGAAAEDDFFNSEHMNARGMKKLTSWYGRYLMEHYPITPKAQSAENAARWEKSADYTEAFYDYYDQVMRENRKSVIQIGETADVIEKLRGAQGAQGDGPFVP